MVFNRCDPFGVISIKSSLKFVQRHDIFSLTYMLSCHLKTFQIKTITVNTTLGDKNFFNFVQEGITHRIHQVSNHNMN